MGDNESNELEAQEQKAFPKRALVIVALGVAVCAAGYFVITSIAPSAPKLSEDTFAVMDAKLQNLDKTVALYGERITRLESELETFNHAKPAPADQSANASSQPGAPSATVSPEDAKRIETLEKDLAALKSAMPVKDGEHVGHSIKLLSAYHRLSDKVLSGKPYADVLSEFQNSIGDNTTKNKPLTQLAAYADNGVPTLAELLTSFDSTVEQLSSSQDVPPPEAGAWDRLVYNLTHLVRIQRIDASQTGKGVDAIVGRAAAHLDKGEVEAAFAEINTLPDTAKASFTGWLEEAQVAIDTPGLIEQLEEQVMQEVFQTSPEAPAATKAPTP